jgi:alpha-L-rhamnosidase
MSMPVHPADRPDERVRSQVRPTRILWKSGAGTEVERAEKLLAPDTTQATIWSAQGCVMRSKGAPAGILLDFGREITGGIHIVARMAPPWDSARGPARVRIRFGESASEALSDQELNLDHSIVDIELPLPKIAGSLDFGDTGFRFVRLQLPQDGAGAEILSAEAVFARRDLEWRGSFTSNDELVNRIWKTGAYTVQLNLQEYAWDGVKRDRLTWAGDLHAAALITLSAFGALPVIPRTFDLLRDETPLPRVMNGISSYTLWWIIAQRDWHLYSGDREYLHAQRPYLSALVSQLSLWVDDAGMERLPETRFLDWPSSEDPVTIHAGLHALLTMAFTAGLDIALFLDDTGIRERCGAALARMSRTTPDFDVMQKTASSLVSLAGLVDPRVMNTKSLAFQPLTGVSTYYGLYILEARAAAGDHAGALDLIRAYWGGMLDLGATTFWEDFDLDWMANAGRIDELPVPGKTDIHREKGKYCYKGYRHSLCHGWAGGPTAWLSRHVLGIRPVEPGFAQVRITPTLCDLRNVEGSFPTPRGDIHVSHKRKPDGTVKTDYECPRGVRAVR